MVQKNHPSEDTEKDQHVTEQVDDDGHEQVDQSSLLSNVLHRVKDGWDAYTADVRVDDDDAATQDAVVDQHETPISVYRGSKNVLHRGKDVIGSFVDGVTGRPHVTKTPAASHGWMTAFHTAVYIFAGIGLIAIVRASIDALKPRR
jgi:hypothetical protein